MMSDIGSTVSASDIKANVLVEKEAFAHSPFMNKLHIMDYPNNEKKKEEHEHRMQIQSRVIKSYLNARCKAMLPCTKKVGKTGTHDIAEYEPTHEINYLKCVQLRTETPVISVSTKGALRGKVKVCWVRNLMHHIFMGASAMYGTKTGPTIPAGWFDLQMQWFMKQGKGHGKNYKRMIGNLDELTKWSTKLPSRSLSLPQPWWFSESIRNAVPLINCKKSPMKLNYSFNLQVVRLLRVMVDRKVGGWGEVTDPKRKAILLDKMGVDTKLTIPIMVGDYRMMGKEEKRLKKAIPQPILATSIICRKSENTVPAGENATIKLTLSTPVYSMYFVAQHVDAIKYGNFSNYTTCPDYVHDGGYPIKSVTHKYSGKVKDIQDVTDYSSLEPWYYAKSSPFEVGYGMHSLCQMPYATFPGSGVIYNKQLSGSITFEMFKSGANDDMKTEQEDVEELLKELETDHNGAHKYNDLYNIYVYFKTCQIIQFDYDEPVFIDDGSQDLIERTPGSSQ